MLFLHHQYFDAAVQRLDTLYKKSFIGLREKNMYQGPNILEIYLIYIQKFLST